MAVRSGAGIGVIVSLVVFVLTTIFLLVLTIAFYAGRQKEAEQRAEAIADLEAYVSSRQRNTDLFKNYEAAARQRGQSVAEYLHQQFAGSMEFVAGSRGKSLDELRSDFAAYGASGENPVADVLSGMRRNLQERQTELDAANTRLGEMQEDLGATEQELEDLKDTHGEELAAVQAEIAEYRTAAEEHERDVRRTIDELEQAKDRLRERYEGRINELAQQNDELGQELTRIKARVEDFERIMNDIRVKPTEPDRLVDGRVIDVAGRSDQIFIDRGKRNRIVLGMSFEVYDDAGSIRPDQMTGAMPRGKASLQVIKVGDTTSTCKITRSVPGRPVVRGDVVANAIYDPQYKFKFLVHGRFDVDGDGRPSEAETEYIRRLIVDWGGSVVYAEELPGDLDFLVLGVEPPMPPPLRDNPTDIEFNTFIRRRAAVEKYQELFEQAREAQIPVLNANRFFILIGHTNR